MEKVEQVNKLRNEIMSHFSEENLPVVRKLLEDYEAKIGRDDFYYQILSDTYLDENKYKTALRLLEEARNRGFNSHMINQSMAEAYYGLERYHDALDELLAIDDSQDSDWVPLIFDLRGLCYEGMLDYHGAVEVYEDYLMESEDPEILVRAAIAYLRMGKEARGLEYLDRFFNITTDTYLDDVYYPLIEMGYTEYAKKFLNRLISDKDVVEDLVTTLALLSQKKEEEAAAYLSQRMRMNPSPDLLAILAMIYSQLGHHDLELKTLRRILQIPLGVASALGKDEDLRHRLMALRELNYTKATKRKYIQRYLEYYSLEPISRLMLMDFCIENDLFNELYSLMELEIPYESIDSEVAMAYERMFIRYLKKTQQFHQLYDYFNDSPTPIRDPKVLFDFAIACCRSGHIDQGIDLLQDLLPDGFSAILLLKIYDLYGMEKESRQVIKFMEDITRSVSKQDIEGYQDYLTYLSNHIQ